MLKRPSLFPISSNSRNIETSLALCPPWKRYREERQTSEKLDINDRNRIRKIIHNRRRSTADGFSLDEGKDRTKTLNSPRKSNNLRKQERGGGGHLSPSLSASPNRFLLLGRLRPQLLVHRLPLLLLLLAWEGGQRWRAVTESGCGGEGRDDGGRRREVMTRKEKSKASTRVCRRCWLGRPINHSPFTLDIMTAPAP